MEKQLKEILERTQIADLHIRYFSAIDEKRLDKKIIEETFTTDAKIVKPNGAIAIGRENILDGNIKSFGRFQATQHTTSDFIINFDGEEANIRVNLVAMHIWNNIAENPSLKGKNFHAGGVLITRAIKSNHHWLISEWTFRNSWRTGEGMNEMARFAKPNQ